MKIMPNRLDRGFYQYQEEFEKKAVEVLRSGWYVLGKEVSSFEEEFAAYVGTKYCVGLASGLDALWLAFRVLGIGAGDEVIVQSNTYIASHGHYDQWCNAGFCGAGCILRDRCSKDRREDHTKDKGSAGGTSVWTGMSDGQDL